MNCSLRTCYHCIVTVKKLPNLSHLSCGLQIRQIWFQLITACRDYCKRRCTKYTSLSWMNWNTNWEWRAPIWIMLLLQQLFISGGVDSSKSVMHVLYTFSWNISHTLLSVGFISGEFVSLLRWHKFWSFFLQQFNGSTCTVSISSFTR